MASRSSCDFARNRSVSEASRPSVLTTRAPSKLSCAMLLTSPRSCCARVISGDIRREYTTVSTAIAGKTIEPTSASTGSVANSTPSETTSMNTTPTANGKGAIGYQVASTSLLALLSSSPVGCSWCHDSGSCR